MESQGHFNKYFNYTICLVKCGRYSKVSLWGELLEGIEGRGEVVCFIEIARSVLQ